MEDGTSALIFFSGPGGGWTEGHHEAPGDISTAPLADGIVRPAGGEMTGSVSVCAAVAGAVFDTPVDVVWVAELRWAHVPAGEPAPAIDGPAVVRSWA